MAAVALVSAAGVRVVKGAVAGGAASGNPPLEVVINEVLYDPEGKDAGLEFVELHNRGESAVCLGGWQLESGNGAAAGRWTREWEGSSGDTVSSGGFFVVGEEMVVPAPDAVADLDLQNGPDACRLVSPQRACDLVGWGDHTYDEYFEGQPAAEAAGGRSLGRDPDGVDTDNNAEDFAGLTPSPSSFNHPPCDFALIKAGRSRYTPPTAAEIDISCLIRNEGSDTCGASADIFAGVAGREFTTRLGEVVGPGGDLRATVRISSPGVGLHPVVVRVVSAADACRANDSLRTSLLVPPPPLVVNEMMFRPAGTDCEWLEVLNRSPAAVTITGWTIEDSNGRPRAITEDDLAIGPGDFVVLVESEDAFEATYGLLEVGSEADSSADPSGAKVAAVLKPGGGWPTLNDVDGPLGFADAVVVRDQCGTAVDSVAYGAAWAGPGVSVERIDPASPAAEVSNWSPHCGSGGSPGRRNSVSALVPDGAGLLNLEPRVFSPDGDERDDLLAVSVRVALPSVVRLSVFDVNGRLVRRLLDGGRVEATRLALWDGRADDDSPAPAGVYIVVVEAGWPGGKGPLRARAAAVLVRK